MIGIDVNNDYDIDGAVETNIYRRNLFNSSAIDRRRGAVPTEFGGQPAPYKINRGCHLPAVSKT